MILTEELAMDLGNCLYWAEATVPCLWPSTDVFRLRIHRTEVQSCFGRVRKQLFSFVFCVVGALHKFHFTFATNENRNKGRPVKRSSYNARDSCFWRDLRDLSGPGSSVGITTGYGLDGPGIESPCERDFPHLSRPALGPTQPPVQWEPALSRG
jgi:hypothetical protein